MGQGPGRRSKHGNLLSLSPAPSHLPRLTCPVSVSVSVREETGFHMASLWAPLVTSSFLPTSVTPLSGASHFIPTRAAHTFALALPA